MIIDYTGEINSDTSYLNEKWYKIKTTEGHEI